MISEQQLSEWERLCEGPEPPCGFDCVAIRRTSRPAISALAAEVREQQKRIAALEADAARYRWLRAYSASEPGEPWVTNGGFDVMGAMVVMGDELDAAIDAARAQETGE